ncbi:phosphatidylcholine/phosphatidylserine synthase [Sphingomonas sp. AOB5]|uniref:CDP-alcohol phosphatidyltransferase family protein n=1 Tax=Sphingomonas sp. AOB5 TaxID=3034017 RepID=UPI0023F6988C|nr:phosphatidylcholine/phosphatidylserine synthase [Sphingomonas sp. AOB5]MDF7773974.1 phosphatidylcholine/phosphatidylserine synthase [Sphingomonas sp. AOB5]
MRPPRLRVPRGPRVQRGIPLRTILPNAVTALALCSGLSGIRFAMDGKWEIAVLMVLIAGILDGIDGRIARLVHGESRFGAELDSLSDAISFGVAPALILFMWSLHDVSRVGWLIALVYALFCALRLARFNAQIDQTVQPHKSAGFLTGVPAPAGAVIAMVPLYLWLSTGLEEFRSPWLVGPWTAFSAILMISSVATWSGASLKLRQRIRFEAIAVLVVLVAAIVSAPWQSLTGIALLYLATIPFSIRAYRRVRRLREAGRGPASAAERSAREP